MATELLAVGIAEATSPTITLAGGETANVFLTFVEETGSVDAKLWIQQQQSGGPWTSVYRLGGANLTAAIPGPGVFRIKREAPAFQTIPVGAQRA